jgi:hypothetical protein
MACITAPESILLHVYYYCRFDVRALLDFYKEPDPRVLAARQKSHEELKLEQVGAAGAAS